MKLVIAEKPSVAMSIAKVLKANNRKNGYMEGNGYIVSWCVGHLVGLANAEEYNEKYKKWDIKDLPIIPDKWETTVFKKTSSQFKTLKSLMNLDRVSEVICATDAGREGELIFRLVYEKAKCKKPIKRLWISSMEESSIKKGFENLREGREYIPLYESALARAKADWLVGINATRLFTCLYGNLLSVGRVQTPTLFLIVDREEKINNFKSTKYYNLSLELENFSIKSERFNIKTEAKSALKDIADEYVMCSEVDEKIKRIKPPLPFDLTTLQRESNRYFGYTAKQTLDYLQSLYEKKWITYPRTDSRYLTEDMKSTLIEIIEFISADVNIESPNINRICNNAKVTDHHAIIPTLETKNLDINEIPKTEQNLYGLICMKLLSSVSKVCIEREITAVFELNSHIFKTTGTEIIDQGYKEIENRYLMQFNNHGDKKEEGQLPIITKGEQYRIISKDIKEGKTTPPKRYTEDTLLSSMERAGREETHDLLDIERIGLGTPATRASIIEKLISVGYVERVNKNLIPTKKAYHLITVVPEELKSPKLTARWENELTLMSMGKGSEKRFINEIKKIVKDIIIKYSKLQR
ncbi:MAG: DNA topoisomerase 3 [Tissierellia bacterium]|nr:DNA topoisomerase 3 [Tissierellia bacterium]